MGKRVNETQNKTVTMKCYQGLLTEEFSEQ